MNTYFNPSFHIDLVMHIMMLKYEANYAGFTLFKKSIYFQNKLKSRLSMLQQK